MVDAKLQRRSPLTGIITPEVIGSGAGVTLRQITDFAAYTVIARKHQADQVRAVLSTYLSATVTDAPRRYANGSLSVTGSAPGQWIIVERAPFAQIIALTSALADIASVIEQSDGKVLLEVSGPIARSALAKGIPIDLDARAFPKGSAAQTVAAHIALQIAAIDDAPTFEILSAASTAANLWYWLTMSAAEFGLVVE